ncbi:segregation and condensation protein A [Desulfurispira natronophila]|uniref:Segregation and condensation protein A n=1 Tax=Desulfurispira natronophila TaxID=682562 RepID=A0A7W7Y6E1_9BACT|nr:segregation/condensation protein A [Desulfurispira natronophila]MBB5022909.1 segregation and condensation protein A [Desulfurispira natronophila]
MYTVSVHDFEGPMDLLLHLIYKNEMDITSISISTIADEYLHHIETMQDLALDVCGEFFVLASTLALIKSRTLLAQSESAPDTVTEELVQKLREYKKYRDVCVALDAMEEQASMVLSRGTTPDVTQEVEADIEVNFDLYDILRSYTQVMDRYHTRKKHEVTLSSINLMEFMEGVSLHIESAGQTCFRYLSSLCDNRLEVIVTFISLLELARLGRIELEIVGGDIQCRAIRVTRQAS